MCKLINFVMYKTNNKVCFINKNINCIFVTFYNAVSIKIRLLIKKCLA